MAAAGPGLYSEIGKKARDLLYKDYHTDRGVLHQAAVTQLGKWECLLVTMAWGFLFRILFYFSLVLGSKNKRR
uniref:Uncharacterized protein n=1 Tax=Zea mays TaxID=4577 RepID=B6UDM4_MAIZE|nr:hypothetical protein [Zea mays]